MTKKLLFSLTKKDFVIQTFRSGGPGGQHEDEEWKSVTEFPCYYISSLGRVLSTKYKNPKLLKLQADSNGYLHVRLCRGSEEKTVKVAHLVAEAFIGYRPYGLNICHNNGDKTDNRVINLRYDTQKNNIRDIYIHEHDKPPYGENNGQAKLTVNDVIRIRELAFSGIDSKEIASIFSISRRQVRDIISYKAWKSIRLINRINSNSYCFASIARFLEINVFYVEEQMIPSNLQVEVVGPDGDWIISKE